MKEKRGKEIILFFFQAEDGIRDIGVTGVQTCALPILPRGHERRSALQIFVRRACRSRGDGGRDRTAAPVGRGLSRSGEIGRASCRERVQISVVAVSLKKKMSNTALQLLLPTP